MTGHGGRVRVREIAVLCALAVALTGIVSCTPAKSGSGAGPGAGSAGGASAKAVPDTAKAVEASIVAAEGGAVGFKTDEAVVRVTFPGEALAGDAAIVATPLSTAPGQDADTLVKGFLLEEKGTGAGPKMNGPAWIEMVVGKELTGDDALVAYNPDGTYEVLPTRIVSKNGVSSVLAFTTHFSPVGGRKVGSDKAKKARDKFSDFDWVVYINNTQKGQTGPIKQTVKLTLRAVNTGGDIAGDYSGSAAIKSTNDGQMAGGTISGPQAGQAASVKITLTSNDALASLTDDDPLASLTPDDMPSWFGSGSIQMSAASVGGTITGSAGGYSGSGGASNTSSLPVKLDVQGTQVKLTVDGLSAGSMTFTGFVRGEGKK